MLNDETYLQVHAENTFHARSINIDDHSTNRQLFRLKRFRRLVRCHLLGGQVAMIDRKGPMAVGRGESEAVSRITLHFRVT